MKKAKIMLMAIAALAIVGGAVAYKTKNTNLPLLCIKSTDEFSSACTTAVNATSNPIFGHLYNYSNEPIIDAAQCSLISCPYEGFISIEEP